MGNYPKEFLELCRSVTAKRPKTIIDHILKNGSITTEEIKELYGYDHPPRAARDVREHGIPLETFKATAKNGRKIGAYRFGDPTKIRLKRFDGRTALSKEIKARLIDAYGCRCFIYLEEMPESELQIDHRIPYEVGGDDKQIALKPDDFMLLCGSANRAKSWSCEQCENWTTNKKPQICLSCYWAYPEKFTHVAMRQIRRLDLIWTGEEVDSYESLKRNASAQGMKLPEYVKQLLTKRSTK